VPLLSTVEFMNKELLSKLVDDFKQTGFGSEMKAARCLLEHGWQVTVSPMFTDLDSRTDREFDVLAELVLTADGRKVEDPLAVLIGLCVEVKKTSAPWVVLRKPIAGLEPSFLDRDRFLFATQNSPVTEDETFRLLTERTPRGFSSWIGYGIHEAFKKPSADQQSYKALTTSIKAARDYFLRTAREYIPIFFDREKRDAADLTVAFRSLSSRPPGDASRVPTIAFAIPTIILDGDLYSVEPLPGDEPDFQKIQFAAVEMRFGTEGYRSKTYTIDIVTLPYLPQYISSLRTGLERGAHQLSDLLLRGHV
jgi:hypothetical protein